MVDETKQNQPVGIFCPKCGTPMSDGAPFCGKCGEQLQGPSLAAAPQEISAPEENPPDTASVPVPESPDSLKPEPVSAPEPVMSRTMPSPQQESKQRRSAKKAAGGGACSVIFSVLAAIFLVVFTLLLLMTIFLHTIAGDTEFPAFGIFNAERMTNFLNSLYPVLFCSVLTAIPLLLILRLNIRRIRRAFLTLGISALSTGLLCIPAGMFSMVFIRLLPEALQDVMAAPSAVLADLSYVCAVIWIVAGSFLISVYSCINVLGGKSNA